MKSSVNPATIYLLAALIAGAFAFPALAFSGGAVGIGQCPVDPIPFGTHPVAQSINLKFYLVEGLIFLIVTVGGLCAAFGRTFKRTGMPELLKRFAFSFPRLLSKRNLAKAGIVFAGATLAAFAKVYLPRLDARVYLRTSPDILAIRRTPKGADKGYFRTLQYIRDTCGSEGELHFVGYYPRSNGHMYVFNRRCGPEQKEELAKYSYDDSTGEASFYEIDKYTNMYWRPSIPLSEWNVTASEALDIALKNGGQEYLRTHPEKYVQAITLKNYNGKFSWEIFIAGGILHTYVDIDAKDGHFISASTSCALL